MDVWFDAHDADHTLEERLDVLHLIGRIGAEELWLELDVDIEGILVLDTIDGDEVVWLEGRELGEDSLDSRWEDIDATDDKHIV